jgi:hypothetical protein
VDVAGIEPAASSLRIQKSNLDQVAKNESECAQGDEILGLA